MNYQDIRENAVEWMIARGWKRRTAKRGGFNQSLFEHTIYELDALLTLWLILSKCWGLSEKDLAALAVGTVAHDVGKETLEWQNYVLADKGTVSYTPHVVEDLTQAAVDKLFQLLGLVGSLDDAKAFVHYHMQATKTTDSLIFDVINRGDKSKRWMTLSNIVAEIDNVCSAKGLLEGVRVLERSSIGKHLSVAYHLVLIRGVSTTLLHRAAIEAYEAIGWRPLLHYSNGTIYVASSADKVVEPTVSGIEDRLAVLVETAMGKDFARAVVTTDFRASAIAMPPLFDHREIEAYLTIAGTRVAGGENRFSKRLEGASSRAGVEKMIGNYLTLSTGKDVKTVKTDTLVRESQRISRAYPEMCIFKFFKAAIEAGIVGEAVTDEARAKYAFAAPRPSKDKRSVDVTPQVIAQIEYDKIFGDGSFDALMKTSTLMPARDMALAIDHYWPHPGKRFGLTTSKVEATPDDERRSALVKSLTEIAQVVYAALPSENQPTRSTPKEIAGHFQIDLLHPSVRVEWASAAQEQLTIYEKSKVSAKSPTGEHLCPICNRRFGEGSSAKAAYLDKPESHTNRAVSHGSPGYIVICSACKYERFIQQLLLGGKPAELLVLFPRMNIGQGSGAELVQKAREMMSWAMLRMSNDNDDPNEHVSLSLTQMIARKLSEQDVFTLSPRILLDVFTYSASDDARKKSRKALEDGLREAFGATVEGLNDSWGTDFGDWDTAVQTLIDGKVTESTALAIRADAYKLQPTLNIVCQTPHLILVPLLYPMAVGKDSEVNTAIRRLFAMLILGLSLDCSVAVLNSGDAITFEGGEGVARVTKVPALRDLVGDEWVSLDQAEKWLKAIGAASLIAQATGLPERSNLYQILSAPTPGHILRRIEQQGESGAASYKHIRHLEVLKEVMQ
ncbi:MAG: hypothetical protein AB1512_04155 [Thermodesulfobacteriota bacterium]